METQRTPGAIRPDPEQAAKDCPGWTFTHAPEGWQAVYVIDPGPRWPAATEIRVAVSGAQSIESCQTRARQATAAMVRYGLISSLGGAT